VTEYRKALKQCRCQNKNLLDNLINENSYQVWKELKTNYQKTNKLWSKRVSFNKLNKHSGYIQGIFIS